MTSFSRTAALAAALLAPLGPALAEPTVYVPLGSAGEILAVDAGTDAAARSIAGLPDVHGLAGTADGRLLVAGAYVETSGAGTGPPPKPPGMSEAEHRAHHPGAASPGAAVGFVSVVRAGDGAILRRIEVPGAVHHTAVTPDGRYAVATHPYQGAISVIDLSALRLLATVPTGPLANYAVAGPDGARVYVTNTGNGTVSEVDTARWIVRRNLDAGASPEHMVLSPDGRRLYVANVEDGTVSEISLAEGTAVRTLGIGGALHGLDLSDDGETLFVAARERGELVAVDLASGAARRAPLGPSPYHLAVVRGTGKLYVSSAEAPKIWVVDQGTLRVLGEIPIRGQGHQMVVVQR